MRPAAWIAAHRVATLTPTDGVPSVVEHVAGERLRGSWWGHAAGHAIYAFASALGDDPDVRVTRLCGRVTFLHRGSWPSFFAVVTDPGFVARASAGLTDADRAGATKRGRDRLVERLLVDVIEVHTERGHHERALRPWAVPGDVGPLPAYDDALAVLREACGGAAPALKRYG